MYGYRDRSYCSDQDECTQMNGKCSFVLTKSEANRADHLGMVISWMTHKNNCIDFKEKVKP